MENPDALIQTGEQLMQQGQFEQALECFEKVIEMHPDNDIAYIDKGQVLYLMKELEEALECFEEAIKIFPDDP